MDANNQNHKTNLLRKYEVNLNDFEIIKSYQSSKYCQAYLVRNKALFTKNEFLAKVIYLSNEKKAHIDHSVREVSIIMRLQFPAIIKYYGYSVFDFKGKNNITIIMGYARKGSLANQIENVRNLQPDPDYDNTAIQIIIIGIARSLLYLHENHLLHRNLKPNNILLDEHLHPLISDFGLSKPLLQHQMNGFNAYTAPEIIDGGKYSQKSDVYSFGILLYEILTNQFPYPEYQSGKINEFAFYKKVVTENYRPTFTVPIKNSLKTLIEQCWSANPNERPTFQEIYNKLAYNDDDYDEENQYYLDNIDFDTVLSYIDEISSTTFKYNIPIEIKQKMEIIEKEHEKLKSDNAKLMLENDQLKNQIISVNLPIGTLFYSSRTENEIEGALKCNGQMVYSNRFPNFVDNYLITKKVGTILISEWNKMKKNGDVGYFGYDGGNVFIVPLISSGTYLSNADVGSIDGQEMKQGNYKLDQINNITGTTCFSLLSLDDNNAKKSNGSISNHCSKKWNSTVKYDGNPDNWMKDQVITFDASKSTRTGDRVMPRTIFENLYVFIGSS